MRSDCFELILTQGFVALLDWEDVHLAKYKWAVTSLSSTRSTKRYAVKDKCKTYLHREVMQAKPGDIVDHINQNGLDCRRSNLRLTTASINGLNTQRRGYCFDKATGQWKAYVYHNKKFKHLGYFKAEEEAARARMEALRELGVCN